jgi:hypothetical protein
VRKAQELIEHGALDGGLLQSIATKTAMFTQGAYPDFSELDRHVRSLRGALSAVPVPTSVDVTQYDLETGTKLMFPERGRHLSQEELRLRWKQMSRA